MSDAPIKTPMDGIEALREIMNKPHLQNGSVWGEGYRAGLRFSIALMEGLIRRSQRQ